MFLDMRSSTTIAEKLGNTAYFNLLASVFSDITPAIVRCKGEIYQYVGDEVVISWEIPSGVQDANCIRCYYAIQQELHALSETYQRKFGIVPEFKAGIHHGSVTAGEVGRIKRDIVYSGDVLNTTSRIQEHCKKLGASLLISEQTFTLISPVPLSSLSPWSDFSPGETGSCRFVFDSGSQRCITRLPYPKLFTTCTGI